MGFKSYTRSRAVHVMLVYTGGCNGCDIEIVNSVLSPKFDIEQYKVFLTWNPREADILVVTGPVTYRNKEPLIKIYESIPNPKMVVAAGSCALMGGVYDNIHGEIESEEIAGPVDNMDFPRVCPKESETNALEGLLRFPQVRDLNTAQPAMPREMRLPRRQ